MNEVAGGAGFEREYVFRNADFGGKRTFHQVCRLEQPKELLSVRDQLRWFT